MRIVVFWGLDFEVPLFLATTVSTSEVYIYMYVYIYIY